MSLDSSLKTRGGSLSQHRSVLSREERIAKLKAVSNYDTAKKPAIGLPKTSNRKVV